MKDIDSPAKRQAEVRYSGTYSRFPFGNVSDVTLSALGFEDWLPSYTIRDPQNPNKHWKVYRPQDPKTHEITVVEVPTDLFGKTWWQAYVGVVEKSLYIETNEQRDAYLRGVQGLIQAANRVEPGALDSRLRQYFEYTF